MLPKRSRSLTFSFPDEWRYQPLAEYEDHLALMPGGLFIVRRESGITFRRPAGRNDLASFFGEENLLEMEKGRGNVELAHKVPYELLLQAIHFFQCVWQQHQREDVLLLYFHEVEQRYELHHPKLLSASERHVDYDLPATPKGVARFGSLHSHGAMSAFHSQEDYRDDIASPGVHIIVGKVNQPESNVVCIASDGNSCFPVPWRDIFTEPPWPEFPAEWLAPAPLKWTSLTTKHPRSSKEFPDD